MCALLAPRPPSTDPAARLDTVKALLSSRRTSDLSQSAALIGIVDDAADRIMPSSTGDHSTPATGPALPPAPTSSPTLFGPPLIAAALGACSHPSEFSPLLAALLKRGADPHATLARASRRDAAGPGRQPASPNGAVAGDTAWLQGATAVHLLMLFGLQQREALIPPLKQLVNGGVSLEALMHGATPLHILCARGPQLPPQAAADLVAAVATPATVSQPAEAAATPAAAALKRALPLHEATPLELATAAAGDDPALVQALLQAQAEVAGEAGTRALMIALTHGKLARARVLLQNEASVVAEVPLQWPPLPPSQARSGVVAAAVSLAPLLTRSAATVCRKSATLLRAAAASPVNGMSTHTRSPAEAPPNGYANGSTGDASPSAAVAVPAQRGERKVVWLSPLQWVVAAGAGAVPTDVVDGQLRRLLHDVLACAPQKGGLGLIPRMPLWNGRGALNACSVELYILRHCPLPYTVLALAAGVEMDNTFEEVEVVTGGPLDGRGGAHRAGFVATVARRISRNAVAALLHRTSAHDDSKPNLVAAAHLLMDSGASPSRVDGETGNTALHDLPRGFASLYPAIRDAGADTTAVNYAGFTPMHCAAARADAPLARLLLRDGADAANGARAGESPTRGRALPSATGVGGPGTAVPAMSARSVAMVQSLAASGAAAPAEDRRGVPPVGSPDVMEEMQGMLAKLQGAPQRTAKRSPTPPRRTGSGVSSSTGVSRGSGTRVASAADTRSGASASSGPKGSADGRTGADGVDGAQRGANTGAGTGVVDGLPPRHGGGGAELRSPVSEASLERMDSGSAHMKLLGPGHLSDNPPTTVLAASALPPPPTLRPPGAASPTRGRPGTVEASGNSGVPKRSVTPAKRVSVPARRISAASANTLANSPPGDFPQSALPRRRAVSNSGEQLARPMSSADAGAARMRASQAATTGIRRPTRRPLSGHQGKSYLSDTASSARKRNTSQPATEFTSPRRTASNGSAAASSAGTSLPNTLSGLPPSPSAMAPAPPAPPAVPRPEQRSPPPQFPQSGIGRRLPAPADLHTPRGAYFVPADDATASPDTLAAMLPASHAEASPARPVPRIALPHSLRPASTSPLRDPRRMSPGDSACGDISPVSVPAGHSGSVGVGCSYGVATPDGSGHFARETSEPMPLLRGMNGRAPDPAHDVARPNGVVAEEAIDTEGGVGAGFGGETVPRPEADVPGMGLDREGSMAEQHSTCESPVVRRSTLDSAATRRTSSVATDIRSYISSSTDSTWPSRPSHGATIRGDQGSATASPLGHAATLPASQFTAHAVDIAAASAAAATTSTAPAAAARRSRSNRHSLRVKAAADALEQGQAIIRKVIKGGGVITMSSEMGDEAFMDWVFQPLPRGRTVLHCVRDTQEHLVRPLVNLGRHTVDVQDRDGNTPLHVAAVDGETAVLRMLVMCSADPSLRNRAGRDALNCAVRSKANTLPIVKTLMKLGVTPDQQDGSGRTALDIAKARATGPQDPLVAFMTRTARIHALQQHRRQHRRQNNR